MSWFYHALMFYVFICQFLSNYSLNSIFRVLIQNIRFVLTYYLSSLLSNVVLCFVVFIALFYRCLQRKPLHSKLTRGNAWMRLGFAPLNILSNITSTFTKHQSFKSGLWILLTSMTTSSQVVLWREVGKSYLVISSRFVNH